MRGALAERRRTASGVVRRLQIGIVFHGPLDFLNRVGRSIKKINCKKFFLTANYGHLTVKQKLYKFTEDIILFIIEKDLVTNNKHK